MNHSVQLHLSFSLIIMADNDPVPCVTLAGEIDSLEKISGSFTTFYGDSQTPPLPTSEYTTFPDEKLITHKPSNMSQPPTIIKEKTSNLLTSIVIEISPGNDVIQSIINFSHRHKIDLVVLNAFGNVSDVHILQNPLNIKGPSIPYGGVNKLISIEGSYMCSKSPYFSPSEDGPPHLNEFSVFFSGDQGVVHGGIVAGKLKAVTVVVVTVIAFKDPKYYRVPPNNDENVQVKKDDEHTRINGY